jgi:hypothetical protein
MGIAAGMVMCGTQSWRRHPSLPSGDNGRSRGRQNGLPTTGTLGMRAYLRLICRSSAASLNGWKGSARAGVGGRAGVPGTVVVHLHVLDRATADRQVRKGARDHDQPQSVEERDTQGSREALGTV